jgi:hypothetical protein
MSMTYFMRLVSSVPSYFGRVDDPWACYKSIVLSLNYIFLFNPNVHLLSFYSHCSKEIASRATSPKPTGWNGLESAAK